MKKLHLSTKRMFYCFGLLLVTLALILSCGQKDPTITVIPPDTEKGPQQYGQAFENVPGIGDINLYEVNPRVFSSSKDLKGITLRLDSLRKLGVNVVWLLPIYPTGKLNSVGSPYAVKDYYSVHEDYGNLNHLRDLVEKAHSEDMAVILDWVANHTAWDNDWISNESWYEQDEDGNIIHPPGTNWLDVAELNYDNPDMRLEMIRAMKYWILEANVDGFRCDYASGVPQDFWQQAIDTLRNIPNRSIILFAESGDKAMFDAGFDLIFGWSYYGKLREVFEGGTARLLKIANTNEYYQVDEGKHIVRWITNHDEHAWDDTPEHIFGGIKAANAAFVTTALMGGVPLVYNGQEVNTPYQLPFFEGNNTTINWQINPETRKLYENLLNLRLKNGALRRGSLQDYSSSNVILFKRKLDQEEVLVMANVRDYTISGYQLPTALKNTSWINPLDNDADIDLGDTISLGAFEFLVLFNQ